MKPLKPTAWKSRRLALDQRQTHSDYSALEKGPFETLIALCAAMFFLSSTAFVIGIAMSKVLDAVPPIVLYLTATLFIVNIGVVAHMSYRKRAPAGLRGLAMSVLGLFAVLGGIALNVYTPTTGAGELDRLASAGMLLFTNVMPILIPVGGILLSIESETTLSPQ